MNFNDFVNIKYKFISSLIAFNLLINHIMLSNKILLLIVLIKKNLIYKFKYFLFSNLKDSCKKIILIEL